MKKGLVAIGVLALLAGGLVWAGVGIYNGLVSRDEGVKNAWAQVENQMQRRYDLIPNLVATVKGYATHEEGIFTQVAEARAKLAGAATINDKAAAASQLEGVLGRLLAIAENYPELKASENFRGLQDELAGTENRLAVERMRYNETVKGYNVAARGFPAVLFVGLMGFDAQKAFFEVADKAAREAPKVGF